MCRGFPADWNRPGTLVQAREQCQLFARDRRWNRSGGVRSLPASKGATVGEQTSRQRMRQRLANTRRAAFRGISMSIGRAAWAVNLILKDGSRPDKTLSHLKHW